SGTALVGHQGLDGDLVVAVHRLALTDVNVLGAPGHGAQLGFVLALLGLVVQVFLPPQGLPVPGFQLEPHLLAAVGVGCQVFIAPP
ncbi:hypothetical protein, partial [Pseudomonas aeruginosa]|uniref:hypothetical protein n=1 Tax=Pseudomonas aeruginosa TaxID=287 RepID=UPI003CC56CA8